MSALTCDSVYTFLRFGGDCRATDDGVRITTHCLYPSFEPVRVYIMKFGESYLVHDRGEAYGNAWLHGRDFRQVSKALERSATRFGCVIDGKQTIQSRASNSEWLLSSVLAVANAASDAAGSAVGKQHEARQTELLHRIERVLERSIQPSRWEKWVSVTGESGKAHRFDFRIESNGWFALIDAVSPHHNSVAAKYVAFSDTGSRQRVDKFAVFDRELDREDKVLLSNVADLIPYTELEKSHGRVLFRNASSR